MGSFWLQSEVFMKQESTELILLLDVDQRPSGKGIFCFSSMFHASATISRSS